MILNYIKHHMIGVPQEIQKKVIAYGHDKQKFLVSDEGYDYTYSIIKKNVMNFIFQFHQISFIH